jgi:hypothetical protein
MMAYCRLQASSPNPLRRFFLPNGILLPNSAHKSVPFLYQFLVLTVYIKKKKTEEKKKYERKRKEKEKGK